MRVVTKGPIDKYPALVQVMAWRRMDNKPLFEPGISRFRGTVWRYYATANEASSEVSIWI